jgi:hypothetical protein
MVFDGILRSFSCPSGSSWIRILSDPFPRFGKTATPHGFKRFRNSLSFSGPRSDKGRTLLKAGLGDNPRGDEGLSARIGFYGDALFFLALTAVKLGI